MKLLIAAVLMMAGIALAVIAVYSFVQPVHADVVTLSCAPSAQGTYVANTGGGIIQYTCGGETL